MSFIFFLLASDNFCIHQNVSSNLLHNSEAIIHINFFSFLFCFCVFSLLSLLKSLKNSNRKEYFDLKERLLILYYHNNFCKNYDYKLYIINYILL